MIEDEKTMQCPYCQDGDEGDCEELGDDKFRCISEWCGAEFSWAEGGDPRLIPAEFAVGDTYAGTIFNGREAIYLEIEIVSRVEEFAEVLIGTLFREALKICEIEDSEQIELPADIYGRAVRIFPYRLITVVCEKCNSTLQPQLWTCQPPVMAIDREDPEYEEHQYGMEMDEVSFWVHRCRGCGEILDKGFDA